MKTLIIAPHVDDEVLGCGVTMLKDDCDVVIMAIGNYQKYGHREHTTVFDRKQEMLEMHEYLGVKNTTVLTNLEGKLDTLPESELVSKLDAILLSNYDRIFIPYPSLHIDHQVTYRVALAAMRLREGKQQESQVLVYEYPFINTFDTTPTGCVYLPHTQDELESKIEAFAFCKSQIKESPSPLNAYGIETLARMRGMEIGTEFAEKYYLHKMIL